MITVRVNIGIVVIVGEGGCPCLGAVRIINTAEDVVKRKFDSGTSDAETFRGASDAFSVVIS